MHNKLVKFHLYTITAFSKYELRMQAMGNLQTTDVKLCMIHCFKTERNHFLYKFQSKEGHVTLSLLSLFKK